MSTFFEKLTGTKPMPQDADTADFSPPRTEPPAHQKKERVNHREAREDRPPRSTHLKVETDDRERGREDAPEPAEEEGELTVDIYDKGDSIVIQSTVAGVKPEDLDVSITNDSVTIRGRRERHEEVREDSYYYKELFWGTFSRSVILPEEIEEDMAEAVLKHGLLSIKLPKKRRGVVQKLKVKVI
ncbi:MAG: Hsp20/alpha crystallin family protein [Patescibacteria group bacterium]